MAAEFVRGDSLREYLTGAASDGGSQSDPALSFGNYRSSTEAAVYSLAVSPGITGLTVEFASGSNAEGSGIIQAVDANNLKWKPYGATDYGPVATFSGTGVRGIVEANADPGQYLRIMATTPFGVGTTPAVLSYQINNYYGFGNVSAADALAGLQNYRASTVKNGSSLPVTLFKRWIGLLGSPASSNTAWLSGAGTGTITTSGTLADWPLSGWVQIRNSAGTLKEVAYYSSRTDTSLTVSVRGVLGTAATAGANTDLIYPVPGIAIGIDTAGVQAAGSSIQTIAGATTPPVAVTWNLGITAATGLQIGTLAAGQQVGIWIWRSIPAGMVGITSNMNLVMDSYSAF